MHAPHKLIDQLQRVADQADATSARGLPAVAVGAGGRRCCSTSAPPRPSPELATQDAAEAFAAEVAEIGHWAGHPAARRRHRRQPARATAC